MCLQNELVKQCLLIWVYYEYEIPCNINFDIMRAIKTSPPKKKTNQKQKNQTQHKNPNLTSLEIIHKQTKTYPAISKTQKNLW